MSSEDFGVPSWVNAYIWNIFTDFKQGEFTGPYMILKERPSTDGTVASSPNVESGPVVPSDKQSVLPTPSLHNHAEIWNFPRISKRTGILLPLRKTRILKTKK